MLLLRPISRCAGLRQHRQGRPVPRGGADASARAPCDNRRRFRRGACPGRLVPRGGRVVPRDCSPAAFADRFRHFPMNGSVLTANVSTQPAPARALAPAARSGLRDAAVIVAIWTVVALLSAGFAARHPIYWRHPPEWACPLTL